MRTPQVIIFSIVLEGACRRCGERDEKGKRVTGLIDTFPHQNQGRSRVLLAPFTRSFLGNPRS